MKHIINTIRALTLAAIATMFIGCASESKEHALVASGFKVITPSTPAMEAKLKTLPTDRVTLVKRSGKSYYVYPDVPNNQVYVGGPKQYQAYEQYRQAKKIADDYAMAAEMNAATAAEWNWGGWGGWGAGWYGDWY